MRIRFERKNKTQGGWNLKNKFKKDSKQNKSQWKELGKKLKHEKITGWNKRKYL